MPSIALIAGWTFLAAALAGAFYGLAAAFAVAAFFSRSTPEATQFPPVTVLKPLHGAEPGLAENLESFVVQDYPAEVQILCGVQGADDSAIGCVNSLKARHPLRDILLVVSPRREEANPKIGNLLGMMPSAKHGVLVLSDSDIKVAPDYLRKVVSALEQPDVGAVTCCYAGRGLGDFWSELSAMGIDYQFLPGVIAGVAADLAKPCFGSTIAFWRSMLDEIGGFQAFRNRLADDYEIGHAIRAKGYSVALPPLVVAHTCTETTPGALFLHELRWARTIRSVDGWGYFGSVVTHAVPMGLLGAICLGFSAPSVVTLAVALISRLFLKWRIDRILRRRGSPAWLLPLRDMLSFAVFVSSFFAASVDWRGQPYRVHTDGALARK